MDILCSTKRDVATLTPQPKNIVDCWLCSMMNVPAHSREICYWKMFVICYLIQVQVSKLTWICRATVIWICSTNDGRSAEETTREANWAILRPNCSGMSTNQRPQGIGTPLVTTWTIPPPASFWHLANPEPSTTDEPMPTRNKQIINLFRCLSKHTLGNELLMLHKYNVSDKTFTTLRLVELADPKVSVIPTKGFMIAPIKGGRLYYS